MEKTTDIKLISWKRLSRTWIFTYIGESNIEDKLNQINQDQGIQFTWPIESEVIPFIRFGKPFTQPRSISSSRMNELTMLPDGRISVIGLQPKSHEDKEILIAQFIEDIREFKFKKLK